MRLFAQDHFVTRNAYVKLFVHQTVIDKLVSLFFGTLENKNVDFGRPLGEFALPVV